MDEQELVRINFNTTRELRQRFKLATVRAQVTQADVLNEMIREYCDKLEQTQAS